MTCDRLHKPRRALPELRIAALCCVVLLAGCAQSEPADYEANNDVLEIEILADWQDDDLLPIDEELPDSVGDADMVLENRPDNTPGE